MRRGFSGLLAVVLVLGLGSEARAETVIAPESDATFNYQRWVNRATIPTPDAEVIVREGECPTVQAAGCMYLHTLELFLVADDRKSAREVFWHELGHLYDSWHLDTRDRTRLARNLAPRNPHAWISPGSRVGERFAHAYRQCELGHHNEVPVVPKKRLRRVCRFLAA